MAATKERQAMLDYLAPYAYALQVKTNIPASLTLAQWADETGFNLRTQGNNLFGTKADSSWEGGSFLAKTWESIKGVKTYITAKFRSYGSILEAFADRASFLGTDKYAGVRQSDPFKGAQALQDAGYATNPNYANQLISHIKTYDLTKYDNPSEMTKQIWLDKSKDVNIPSLPSGNDPGNANAGWTDILPWNKGDDGQQHWWEYLTKGIWGYDYNDIYTDSTGKAPPFSLDPGTWFKQGMFAVCGLVAVYLGFKLLSKGKGDLEE